MSGIYANGELDAPIYKIWKNLKWDSRAHGLPISKRWSAKHGFGAFLKDMGEQPADSYLSRKVKEKGYTRSNCEWRKHRAA
jgi:hypothetical protein